MHPSYMWMYVCYIHIWCPSFYIIINLRSVIMSNLDYATWLQNSNEGGDFIVFYFLREPPALPAHPSAALQPSCPPYAKFKTGQGQGRRCNFSSRSTAAYVLIHCFAKVFIPYTLWFSKCCICSSKLLSGFPN